VADLSATSIVVGGGGKYATVGAGVACRWTGFRVPRLRGVVAAGVVGAFGSWR
jgi:hypothetical protein